MSADKLHLIDDAEFLRRIEVEADRQAIRNTCLRAMRGRKCKWNERLQAAGLLAGIDGIYGSTRRVSSAAHTRQKKVESNPHASDIRSIGTLIGSTGSKPVAQTNDAND